MAELITLDANARELWEAFPCLRYAFPDYLAFFQTQLQLSKARNAEFMRRVPELQGNFDASCAAGAERMQMVRRPLTERVRSSLYDRTGNRLILWNYGPMTTDRNTEGACVGSRLIEAIANNQDAAALILRTSSAGGEVAALRSIQRAIAHFAGRTIAVIDHFAFSAAAELALMCDRVVMRANAVLMLHRTIQTVSGNCRQLSAASCELRADDDHSAKVLLASRRKASPNDIAEAINSARYISAQEALQIGLVDVIAPSLMYSDELIAQALPPEAKENEQSTS